MRSLPGYIVITSRLRLLDQPGDLAGFSHWSDGSKRRARWIIPMCYSLWTTGWDFVFVQIIYMLLNPLLEQEVIHSKCLMWFTNNINNVIYVGRIWKIYCHLENVFIKCGANSLISKNYRDACVQVEN